MQQRIDDALEIQSQEFDQKVLSYERQIADLKYGADAISQKVNYLLLFDIVQIQLARNNKFGMLTQ